MSTEQHFDLIIAGAGILGAACAHIYLERHPGKRVAIVEKELQAAQHQTGRNSGVIHAGVYYQPGSLKARYCREGLERTLAFCRRYNLPFLQCGKLIVATDDKEEERLNTLYHRCQQNQLSPVVLDERQLAKEENAIRGKAAIYVAQTGITDYTAITRTLLGLAQSAGAQIFYNHKVTALEENGQGIRLRCGEQHFRSDGFVNCAGLYADNLIRLQGLEPDFRIIPFRGEYFRLDSQHNDIIRHLIYPVPDPELPFLGVHLTRMIDGSVTVGPNAVLALAREAYSWRSINAAELSQTLSYPGLWKLLSQYWRSGISEMYGSLNKRAYLDKAQRYCPQLQLADLKPYRSGIRAQAVSQQGELLHDFRFVTTERSLHLGNAPSPAATSALPIAEAVVDKLS
ncbi:L-2-hydroxyglutarate oxidase [Lacimicrobium sp. SS2-24]|uniref:L-2-hydroxyglutarate oxidase n=1 Tax=Lacimicrobium sp. SS2-24 TaxID=2005569 RepID=UPI000B4B3695|nr:L-2-hydroxyglutarate oxidase [Lacimicrobium sp. SS2-24]